MFTGIIERTLNVIGVADGPNFRRVTLPRVWEDVELGESVAVNGCCLTVAELDGREMGFDVIAETLGKTNLGMLVKGEAVNVERSLRVGDRIDGHFVQGHVDGLARLVEVEIHGSEWRMSAVVPGGMGKYLVPKGSVAIDGISLTIAEVRGERFTVALIPTTLERTTLKGREVGWLFNFEADSFAKTIVSFLEHREVK